MREKDIFILLRQKYGHPLIFLPTPTPAPIPHPATALQNVPSHPTQVWFQNARAKFRRNLLRQENTGVDKATEAALQTGTPSGPASELSNASLSPSSTPTTLTDLTSPTLPTVTSVLTSVPGNLEGHEPHSPSQTTLTNLF